MKFVPLNQTEQQTIEGGDQPLRFVPLQEPAARRFVPLAAQAAPETSPISDPMGAGDFSAIANVERPKLAAERAVETLPPEPKGQVVAPGVDKMLDPKFITAVEAQLNALPEDQRMAALAGLVARPDVYGRAAQVVQQRYAQLDKTRSPTLRAVTDLRLEPQIERFIEQGAPRDLAEHLARQQALSGRLQKGVSRMEPDVVGTRAAAEAETRARELEDAGFTERVGAEVASQLTKTGLGLINVYADITGDRYMQNVAANARRVEDTRQGAIPKGVGVFERSAQGAISSLATQAPMAVLSMVTGTAAPVLLQAGVQQFGDSYGEGRAAGLSSGDALTRAVPMAAAEVFFERFGMERALGGLRAFIAKNGYAEVPKYVAQAIATEIPPELATTVAQYGIDMLPEVGLKKNPSLLDLYNELEETLRQTVIQAGAQSGVIATGAKGAEKLSKVLQGLEPNRYRRDVSYEGLSELLARSKGFLATKPGATPARAKPTVGEGPLPAAATVEPAAEEGPLPGAPAAPVPDVQRVEELTRQGIEVGLPEEDARSRAERIVAQEGAARTRQEEERLAPRVETLTQEFVDAGMEPTEARTRAVSQAQEEAQADAIAERDLAESRGAAPLEPEPSRAGVEVAGRPEPGAAPEGVAGVEPLGVAPAGRAAEGVAGGEGAVPAAVGEKFNPFTFATQSADSAFADSGSFDSVEESIAAHRENVVDTLREQGRDNPRTVDMALDLYDTAVNARIGAQPAQSAEPPKKRGRPAVLTPEEKAQKAAEKKPLQAAKMRADRAVSRIISTLDESAKEFDPSEYENQEAALTAYEERAKQKRQAIQELMTMQSDPALRGTKVAARIKEALKHPNITPQELADLKKGLEAKKASEQVSRASSRAPAAPDARFAKFTSGAQALSHIIKTGNAFQKMLGKRLRAFVGGVRFVVIEAGQDLPDQLKTPRNAREWDNAFALYIENGITGDKVIYVRGESFGNDQGINNVTILHELLHAATNRKVTLALDAIKRGVSLNDPLVRSAQALLRTMVSAGKTYNDMARAGTLPPEIVFIAADRGGEALTDAREFIAYGMSDERFQKFLMQAQGYEEDTSFFNQFVRGVRKLFGMGEDTTNALSDLILITDTILSSRAPSKGVFARETVSASAKPPEPTGEAAKAVDTQKKILREEKIVAEKYNQSVLGDEYSKSVSALQMMQKPGELAAWFGDYWDMFTGGARTALAYTANTDFLVDAFSKKIPELKNTQRLTQQMRGTVMTLLKAASTLTDDMARAFRKDKTLQDKLNRITIESTLLEIDPSAPSTKGRSQRLEQMWRELGDEGRSLYTRIRDHFKVLSEYTTQLLEAQITDSDLPVAAKANMLSKIRAMYEQSGKIEPFFPLMRQGEFSLGIGSGKTRKFYLFDTARARNRAMRRFADERIKQKPGESRADFAARRKANLEELLGTEEYVIADSLSELRTKSGTDQMLRDVFDAIDGMSFGESATSEEGASRIQSMRENLKDSVYQIYLRTLPDQSFRKQFIHRKGITGFKVNILQSTADASSRLAYQIARLKYGKLINNSLSQARDSIRNQPQYEPIVEAVSRRVLREMNPTPPSKLERVASAFTRLSFFHYLGASASALLQPLSVFQIGYPVLASKYGANNTHRELGKMMKFWNQYGYYKTNSDGSRSFIMPTIEHAPDLTEDERRAVRDMARYNVTAATYAADVFDYANTPQGHMSHPFVEVGKDTFNALFLGGLMNVTERISREMVYLSAYRLARSVKNKSHDEAVLDAVDATNESLFNYNRYNRPDFMKGASGAFLTQFMMFQVSVTLFLLRNFVSMVAPLGGDTRAEAFKKFFGVLGTTAIIAGAVGVPGVGMVLALAGLYWRAFGDDEPDQEMKTYDFPAWFRLRFIPEYLGEMKIAGKSIAEIVERGVINALTGWDVGSRTSLNNIWIRDTKETATIKDEAEQIALSLMGPTVNMAVSYAEGMSAFMQGDYAKGAKKIAPAGFRAVLNAYELASKGAETPSGKPIASPDAFTFSDIAGQAIGFRPDKLSAAQYALFKVIGVEQQLERDRNELLDRLDRAFRENDAKAQASVDKEIDAFNRRFPRRAITGKTRNDAITNRAQQRAESIGGYQLNEKTLGLARSILPSYQAIKEAERKGRGE